jgi:hypothetical protein
VLSGDQREPIGNTPVERESRIRFGFLAKIIVLAFAVLCHALVIAVQDRVYRFAMLALDQLTHVGKDTALGVYRMDSPEFQVTSKSPRGLGVYRMDSPEFQVTSKSPHVLDVYRMNLPEFQVTWESPRRLGVHMIDPPEFQVTWDSPST